MKALWLENQQLDVREISQPDKPAEALLHIRLAGICSTDLELVKGYYPYAGVPGHEFVGEVVEAPDEAWAGQRVVGEINAACGACEQCRSGRPTHCEKRTVLGIANRDGVFAEYTSLPLTNLHLVPDGVRDEEAVFTEPLAAALEIQEQVHVRPSERVLVIGAGRLGQFIAQTLALRGCNLRVLARHAAQRKLLTDRYIRPISEEEIEARRWDLVVEATGSPAGFELARRAIRPRGTLVMKSTYKGEMTLNFSPLVVDEITIIGSRCGPFEPALRLLEEHKVDVTPLIAARYRLKDSLEAFEQAGQPGTLKVLIEP